MAIWDGSGGRGGGEGKRGRDESGRERIRKNKFVEMRCDDTTLTRSLKTPITFVTSSPLGTNQQNRPISFSSHKAVQSVSAEGLQTRYPSATFLPVQGTTTATVESVYHYACFCFPVRNFLK